MNNPIACKHCGGIMTHYARCTGRRFMLWLMGFATTALVACAPANQQHQSTAWTMAYYCCNAYNSCNAACVNNFHAYSGSGSFSSESDCLAWETGFLNIYRPQANCTSCQGN